MNLHSPSKIKALVFAIFTILFPSLLFAQDCTEGNILFESNYDLGGPAQISYTLINANTEELILNGGLGFVADPSESVDICLPVGCYALTVQGNPEQLSSDFFFTGIIIGGESIEMDINFTDGSMLYEFCLFEPFNCPSEIEVNQSPNPCGSFVFTIPGYEDYSGIQWFTPDGVVNNGSGIFEYIPVYPGIQEVCAFLETPECPLGVELCAVFESNCDQSCEVFLSYDLTDNGGVTVYAEQIFGGVFPETYYEWIVDGEFTNNIGFVFETSFDDCEEHQICVVAWNSFCESDACITIQTDGCEDNCPNEMWVGNNDCTYSFEVGSFQEGETATWYIGDQVFEGGHFFQHQFLESGTYDVCVDFSSNSCPGTEICTTIEVEACNNCDATFFCDVVEDQLFLSPINANEDLVYTWFINDEFYTNEIFGVYPLTECGAYQVCLNVSDPQGDCDEWFCDVMVYDGCENDCPESIDYGNDGCNYWFEVGSAWEDESVTWFIGGMVFEGGHYLEVDNIGLTGPQTVSAQLNNGACEGVQLTTIVEFSGDCGCSSDFEWGISENGIFYASPNEILNQDIYYSWVIDGDWLAGSQYAIEVPLECGPHEVCLYMESGFCLSNSCEEIFVECSNCELELTADVDNCSGYFTIQNPEASEISWSTENGEVYTGNNIMIDFESDGLQLVCVNAVLPGCGVVDACITVETEFCEATCTLMTFAMDSYVNDGGPEAAYMNIIHESGESWFLNAEFGPNDFYYDGELCLPNGCYDVIIDTPNGTDNPDSFFSSAFLNGQNLGYTYGPTWNGVLYEYGFALNSDCEQDECNLNVSVEQQEGSWYLFNAITDVWEQNVSWFINDEFIASGQTFAYDFPVGNHELCAMIETPDCPEGVWSCMDIVVGEEEFCTPIAIQIVADNVLLEDLWIDYSIESIFGEIGGEVYLSNECGETYILACIPNACYELTLSVEEALLVPLLMNAFVDGPLTFEYTLDPESAEMNVAFGINTDCENSIIETDEDQTLKIYPIPANQDLNVVLPASSLGGEWQMINATGQVVDMGKVEKTGLNQFRVAELAAGVYHFQVSYEENHQQKRLQTTWTIAR